MLRHLYFASSRATSPLRFDDSFSLSSHPLLSESMAVVVAEVSAARRAGTVFIVVEGAAVVVVVVNALLGCCDV
jgi:hypothetical protein